MNPKDPRDNSQFEVEFESESERESRIRAASENSENYSLLNTETNQELQAAAAPEEKPNMASGRISPFSDELLALWVDAGNKALVVKTITFINIAIFLAMAVVSMGQSLNDPSSKMLIEWGGNAGYLTLNGDSWRMVSAAFLHSGWLHIAMNMVVLWDVGPLVEKIFGSRRFLLMYFFAAVTASLNSLFWNPAIMSVGASGAVFGMFGALLAFYQSHKTAIPQHVIKEKSRVVLAVIGYNLIFGLMQPNIDNAGHLGGLIGGFLIGLLLSPREPLQRAVQLKEMIGVPLLIAACFGVWTVDKMLLMDKDGVIDFQSAVRLYDAGNTAEARRSIDRGIKIAPDRNPAAYLFRASMILGEERNKKDEQAKFDEALQDIDTALRLDPKVSSAYRLKAIILTDRGNYKQALENASKAIALDPQSESSYLVRARAEAMLNYPKESIADIDSALKINPKSGEAYITRGLLYSELGDDTRAAADLREGIKLGENAKQAYSTLALNDLLSAKFPEAIEEFDKAMQLYPEGSERWIFLCILKSISEQAKPDLASARSTLINGQSKLSDEQLKKWPAPILSYLLDEMSAQDLEKKTANLGQLTEAKTYVGMQYWADGKRDYATYYLGWVLKNGPKDFTEYKIAKRLLYGNINPKSNH